MNHCIFAMERIQYIFWGSMDKSTQPLTDDRLNRIWRRLWTSPSQIIMITELTCLCIWSVRLVMSVCISESLKMIGSEHSATACLHGNSSAARKYSNAMLTIVVKNHCKSAPLMKNHWMNKNIPWSRCCSTTDFSFIEQRNYMLHDWTFTWTMILLCSTSNKESSHSFNDSFLRVCLA